MTQCYVFCTFSYKYKTVLKAAIVVLQSVDLGQKGRRRRTEYDSKQFVCQYEDCDKAFFRKDHLIRHQRQKHGKPFGVDSQLIYYCYDGNCGKTFYNVASLRRHMIMIHNYGNC